MNIHKMTIQALSGLLERKELSSAEMTAAFLDRIQSKEPELNAFITVTRETALEAAAASDARRARGQAIGPLDGIPFALKDNFSVKGLPMTCASKMLSNYRPPYTATAAGNLMNAGAVLLGKNNMDEFAIGSSTENSAYGAVKNPLDARRVPGGSSGGSAACVAAGEAAFSLGSDTGGSVRQPAACCGIVGLKPTYGVISRYGVTALASSLDQVGLLARNVRDTALLLNHTASYDPRDPMSSPRAAADYSSAIGGGVAGKRFGVVKEYLGADMDPDALAWVQQAADRLRAAGASVEEVSMPNMAHCLACYYVLMSAEFHANMGRFDGLRFGMRADGGDYVSMVTQSRTQGLGPEVKTRILFGTYVLREAQYEKFFLKAMKVRTLICRDYEEVFKQVDCLLTPVQNGLPFQWGSRQGDSVKMAATDKLVIPSNLAGLPALALPFGFAEGLPGAVQLIGKPFSEAMLLGIAEYLEQEERA
jgi:aspartyl-tRNA(Asn)/glutamyl-tRNA(Gln) amidotransferase subunit A